MTSTPITSITRTDLPEDPAEALQRFAQVKARHLEDGRHLNVLQGQIAREIAGSDRGGVARLAAAMGVSNTAAGELLVKSLVRAVRAAAGEAGVAVTIRTLGQAHPARVAVALADGDLVPDFSGGDPDSPDFDDSPAAHQERAEQEERWRSNRELERANDALALLSALCAAGLAVDAGGEPPRDVLAGDDGEWIVSWRS
jgi:hypothetical protein